MIIGDEFKLLDIRTWHDAGTTVLEVAGELDVYTAPRLREQLADQARAGRHHLIVDMTEVAFMDSSGLGVLVGGLKRARTAGGSVTLTGANAHIHDVLRITGLLRVFPVCATTAEALSAAGR
ncbi:MAG TPA: STAS domain-containing protein [Actinocrinis sp.]|nr:STAS domain-containing protein [Actinocrinis sp.]